MSRGSRRQKMTRAPGNSVEITVIAEVPDSINLLAGPTGTSDQGDLLYFRDAFISRVMPPSRPIPADSHNATISSGGERPYFEFTQPDQNPVGIWVDPVGNFYFTDRDHSRIYKVTLGRSH